MGNKMSSNKDVMKVVKKARKQGWRVTKAKSNHLQFYPPNNYKDIIVMSSTPRSPSNFKHCVSLLKDKGLNI